jgi:tetrahydromethanopterin S-methyltransferase subunit G
MSNAKYNEIMNRLDNMEENAVKRHKQKRISDYVFQEIMSSIQEKREDLIFLAW